MKSPLRCVETLIFVIPARMASWSCASDAPDDPCSTSGTGTARCSSPIRSMSSDAVRSVIACDEPTATASASTPVAATKSRASAGSVRTPGACAPSLPPTCAELGLDVDAGGSRAAGDPAGGLDVVVVVEVRAVEHDRAEAEGDRLPGELLVLGVVEVHGDGHRRRAGDGQGARAIGSSPPW